MIPENIYEIGDILGLEYRDIQDLISDKSSLDSTDNLEIPSSPVDSYKEITLYGTVSINDF